MMKILMAFVASVLLNSSQVLAAPLKHFRALINHNSLDEALKSGGLEIMQVTNTKRDKYGIFHFDVAVEEVDEDGKRVLKYYTTPHPMDSLRVLVKTVGEIPGF
ncbi:MAG: hypothetical protein JKY15_08985 [Deltaproteobacteria bacterium]|nr:hypothetical protein [Deltaproteobacteria bacterium]